MQISKIRTLWPREGTVDYAAEIGNIPTWQVYSPSAERATGAVMVIFPGGGYGELAGHEGPGYAEWLAAHGVTGIVVNYRLGTRGHRHPAMLQDAARAVRLARYHAAEHGLDRQRIGVMGSSAGGHLAATLLTQFDAGTADSDDPVERESSRPDLGVLCYPVITFGALGHDGTRDNLLGQNPSLTLVEQLSAEKHVTVETPPCFVWHTWEDGGVPVENAMFFAAALREKGVRFELHVYERGGHGMGLGDKHRWAGDCLAWLRERSFVD
ncbi:MAG: alpha/beta hydrolase [Verrucomicrobiales bacterium]|jgi:acetyl esterase/lipase|nr:alpha/beta hydrolase [Verrucomicrobiales bacterium]